MAEAAEGQGQAQGQQGNTEGQGQGQGQGEGGGAAGGGNGEGSGSGAPTSWLESLPEDLRQNEAFKDFKDHGEFAKSFLEMKKQADDLKKANEELTGKLPKVAETPEGYTVEIPEGLPVDKDFMSAMQASAHKYGIGVDQFQNFAKDYMAMQQAYIDHIRTEQEAASNALKIEWGAKYDDNVTVAQQAFKKFAPSDSESKYLKDTGLAADPVLIRMFQRVGLAMSEDHSIEGDGGVGVGDTGKKDAYGRPMLDFPKSMPKK